MSPALTESTVLKILVVDDEEPIRLVLEAILVLTGYQVGLASDGLAGCGKFQSERWDFVLTDRQMPKLDGLQFARVVKERSPQTPVIMVTGVPPPEDCADVDAIVLKPFSLDTILQAIDGCRAAREPAPGGSSIEAEAA